LPCFSFAFFRVALSGMRTFAMLSSDLLCLAQPYFASQSIPMFLGLGCSAFLCFAEPLLCLVLSCLSSKTMGVFMTAFGQKACTATRWEVAYSHAWTAWGMGYGVVGSWNGVVGPICIPRTRLWANPQLYCIIRPSNPMATSYLTSPPPPRDPHNPCSPQQPKQHPPIV